MENTFEELEGKVMKVKFVECGDGDFMKLSRILGTFYRIYEQDLTMKNQIHFRNIRKYMHRLLSMKMRDIVKIEVSNLDFTIKCGLKKGTKKKLLVFSISGISCA